VTALRDTIMRLPASRIREVANAGLGRNDVLAFWFGESDEVTPAAIRAAAAQSLSEGETFYAHNLGLPALREALARYMSELHGPIESQRIAVTSGGVNALMIAVQALVDAGDEVVAVVPVWPNLTAQPQILGAQVERVALVVRDARWELDLDAVRAAVTPRTRVLLLNAPSNPTGWSLTREQQRMLLDHCRTTGTWIIADEVYERLFFAGTCAPSFLDIAAPQDRLLVAHSFSKSFLMTGWRLGWLVCPPDVTQAVGKLIEFNTSCAPVFVQRGALAALQDAAQTVPALVSRLQACRDRLVGELRRLPRVEVAEPPAGMYAFLRVRGEADSMALAKRLVAQVGLGLAPGVAFGAEGEGWLRWCFASREEDRLSRGVERLAAALAA
jgi:aspartate/methionine/tyrosine aminotransferase